jgi:hypothetical protein
MLWHEDEQNLVIRLNKNKKDNYWNILNIIDNENYYAIWVDKKIISNLTNKFVLPKSDIIIAKIDNLNFDILLENNYLLTDKLIDNFSNVTRIDWTWISVKKEWSKSYTITKMTPDTFKNIFWTYILWAGWSIYCKNEEDIWNNVSVITWWKSKKDDFIIFFKNEWIIENSELDLEDYKKIKHYSLNKISEYISTNDFINSFIFRWKWSFSEPYCCTYFFQNWILTKNTNIPFSITTWSWRSKWDFTIVVKPR